MEDLRCVRCGCWPDQVRLGGDWLIAPVHLCPSCHERLVFLLVRDGGTALGELTDADFPHRGRSKRRR